MRGRSTTGAAFVFTSLGVKRGGVTRAVIRRARHFAQSGIPVRLLLTGFGYQEDQAVRDVQREWGLPDSVEVRYFWREAAPGGGGAPAPALSNAKDEAGLTRFAESSSDGETIRFYDNGLLTKAKRFDSDDRLQAVTYYDRARRAECHEHFDLEGRLVYVEHLNPDTGSAVLRRWFDRTGECWLTTWMNPNGNPAHTVRHRPDPVAYDHFGDCVAEWVDSATADWDVPVVIVDTRRLDTVLRGLKHPGARSVAVLHNCHTYSPYRSTDPTKASWHPLFDRIDKIDAVVALTHQQKEDLQNRYRVNNITVINHDTPPVRTDDVPREDGLLVALARFDYQKQLDHAIRAFSMAAAHVPHARFEIYGKGSDESKLKRLIRELGMSDRIRICGFTSDSQREFSRATATVLSSRFEGLPLVLTEAMGVGTPFVAYDINYGPSEVIRHEVDGLLVPPGDIEALSDALIRVLGDPAYAAQLGERAREVTRRFSTERWSSEWLEIYRRLMSARPQPDDQFAATGS